MINFETVLNAKYGNGLFYGSSDRVRIARILELAGSGKMIADLGCADGYLSEMLVKQNNTVVGVDLSPTVLKLASRRGIKTVAANLEEKTPLQNSSFDVVVAAEIIEHLVDTDHFIDEVARILRPDGFFVLTTSNLVSLGRRLSYLIGRDGYHEASFCVPAHAAGHVRYFNKQLLFNLLNLHNFKVEYFGSDVVNFSYNTGSGFRSRLLADLFPTLGRSLIVKAVKDI